MVPAVNDKNIEIEADNAETLLRTCVDLSAIKEEFKVYSTENDNNNNNNNNNNEVIDPFANIDSLLSLLSLESFVNVSVSNDPSELSNLMRAGKCVSGA